MVHLRERMLLLRTVALAILGEPRWEALNLLALPAPDIVLSRHFNDRVRQQAGSPLDRYRGTPTRPGC